MKINAILSDQYGDAVHLAQSMMKRYDDVDHAALAICDDEPDLRSIGDRLSTDVTAVPNPSHGEVTILTGSANAVDIDFFAADGSLLHSLSNIKNGQKVSFKDYAGLVIGQYINQAEKVMTFRFIIVR